MTWITTGLWRHGAIAKFLSNNEIILHYFTATGENGNSKIMKENNKVEDFMDHDLVLEIIVHDKNWNNRPSMLVVFIVKFCGVLDKSMYGKSRAIKTQ